MGIHSNPEESARGLVKLLFLIGVVHLVFAFLTFDDLPDRIPIHFDAAGQPDGYAGASVASWYLLWFVSAALGLIFGWFSLAMHRIPARYINMPRKEEYLALPEEARERVMWTLAFHMLVLIALLMLFFLGIHISMAMAALGRIEGISVGLVWGGAAALTLYSILMLVFTLQAVNRELDGKK